MVTRARADTVDQRSEDGEHGFTRREILHLGGIMGAAALTLCTSRHALAALSYKPPATKHVVVLDPGHGGVDPGCIGYSGTYEKQVVFAIATEAARLLEATGRYRPVLTRRSDQFIPLHGRVAFARSVQGDLFMSIHADAIPNHSVRGASIFTLSEHASDAGAAALAAKENEADIVGGVDLGAQPPEISNILLDLARRETNGRSLSFARDLVANLGSQVHLLGHSHRSAGFAVLKAPDIPSALVESGCLSNREEERALCSPAYRRRIAVGMVASIESYFNDAGRA